MQPSSTLKRWPWIALAGAVLAGVGVLSAYDKGAEADKPTVTAVVSGGSVTHDGTFEYTVTGLTCDVKVAGATAKGRFCKLGLIVDNASTTVRKPGIAFAKVYDAQGAGYLADGFAQVRSDGSGSSLLDDLSPGARRTAHLIYDIPKTATLTAVELHESPTSPPIVVPLAQ